MYITSAGKALHKRAKIGELNCLEEETDVRESLQSQFSFFQRAGMSLKASWAACWVEERRDACSPGHGPSICPWLLGAVCFSRLESESCINLEHSGQKDTPQRMRKNSKTSPQKPARVEDHGSTSYVPKQHWSHTLRSSNQLFSVHCIISRNKLSDAVLKSLKADLLSIFSSASWFFSFILYWLDTPNSSAVLKPEFACHSTEWLQQQPGRAGHQAACPVGLFLMLEPSHWKAPGAAPSSHFFTSWGLWHAHWCQADRQWVLGLLLCTHLPTGARLGLQLLNIVGKKLCWPQEGGKWPEWLCPKGNLFCFKKASD